jgi:asparagine synthetase B (glutamine-hydrolysing)
MCGISAIVGFAGNAADDLRDLERTASFAPHRGPDAASRRLDLQAP